MSNIRSAKISVHLGHCEEVASKYFVGAEDEIYKEAHDWTYEYACRYINKHDITYPPEQVAIIESATHTIEWDINPPTMFAVVDIETDEGDVLGIYHTRADAEEAIFSECDDWTYGFMMTQNPKKVFGVKEWDYRNHYWGLMHDSASCFTICEAPVF